MVSFLLSVSGESSSQVVGGNSSVYEVVKGNFNMFDNKIFALDFVACL